MANYLALMLYNASLPIVLVAVAGGILSLMFLADENSDRTDKKTAVSALLSFAILFILGSSIPNPLPPPKVIVEEKIPKFVELHKECLDTANHTGWEYEKRPALIDFCNRSATYQLKLMAANRIKNAK